MVPGLKIGLNYAQWCKNEGYTRALCLPENAKLDFLALLNNPVRAGGSAEASLVALVDRGSNLNPESPELGVGEHLLGVGGAAHGLVLDAARP